MKLLRFSRSPVPDSAPVQENAAPPIIIREGLLGKLVMGLFCSSVIYVLMNFANLKWFVIHGFALFLSLFGAKEYVIKPTDAAKQVASDALGKLGDKVPGIHLSPVVKTPEQLKIEAEQKEAERIRKEKSEILSWQARAQAVSFVCDKNWTLEKYRVEVPRAERRAEEAEHREREARRRAEEEERKKALYARADKIGLLAEPSWELNMLKSKVLAAEEELANDAEYQAKRRKWEAAMKQWEMKRNHGSKGLCVNPRCRNLLDLDGSIYPEQCQVCLTICRKALSRALYAGQPPGEEPTPPEKNPGLFWKVFK